MNVFEKYVTKVLDRHENEKLEQLRIRAVALEKVLCEVRSWVHDPVDKTREAKAKVLRDRIDALIRSGE